MMKPISITLVALLSAICIFLFLYAVGAFNYGMPTRNNQFAKQANARNRAVNSAKSWRIGVIGNVTDPSYVSGIAPGIAKAALLFNIQGGIEGKMLDVSFLDPEDDRYNVKLAAQELSEKPETALLLGPMYTTDVKSLRALSWYYALPMLSPFATLSPELPKLEPDICSAVYPTHMLIPPLIEKLKEMNCKNLLFISTQNNSFGGTFTIMLSQALRRDPFFHELHRINFTIPATSNQFFEPLRRFRNNTNFDAIIFTDSADNLQILGGVMRELEIKVPVFGNDFLDIPQLDLYVSDFNFPLYYVSFQGRIIPEELERQYREIFGDVLAFKEQWGILSCWIFKEAMKDIKKYDAVALGKKMKELSDRYFTGTDNKLNAVVRKYRKPEEKKK